jgi:hypothetical protein
VEHEERWGQALFISSFHVFPFLRPKSGSQKCAAWLFDPENPETQATFCMSFCWAVVNAKIRVLHSLMRLEQMKKMLYGS